MPKAGFIKRLHYNGIAGVMNTCTNGHWPMSGGWREGRAVDWELGLELQLCKEGESQLLVSPAAPCFEK